MSTLPYGLGAIQSPPDERDLQISAAFIEAGLVPVAAPPTVYDVLDLPAVVGFDQGDSPKCVAYSNSLEQASFDLTDLGHNYLWDRDLFFKRIHGTANGAIPRVALQERLKRGYPLLPANSGNSAAAHRISAYYAVEKNKLAIQQAMLAFGALLFSGPWFNSWFSPGLGGLLPRADYQVGGHEWTAVGWRANGVRCEQSWGSNFGDHGFFIFPWAFVGSLWECWKAIDVKTGGG